MDINTHHSPEYHQTLAMRPSTILSGISTLGQYGSSIEGLYQVLQA